MRHLTVKTTTAELTRLMSRRKKLTGESPMQLAASVYRQLVGNSALNDRNVEVVVEWNDRSYVLNHPSRSTASTKREWWGALEQIAKTL